ncbi:tetratricopeptide repeat protein [bacterium]|nr:tetratricopeptide repeat protein [bacterium]
MKKVIILWVVLMTLGNCVYAQKNVTVDKDAIITEIGMLVNDRSFNIALRKCNSALEIFPEDAALYYWKGTIESSLGNKKSALQAYNKSIELNPDYAKTYVMRGICKLGLGDREGALNDYNKAIELDPKNSSAYSMRAIMKLEFGDYAGASQDLEISDKLINEK